MDLSLCMGSMNLANSNAEMNYNIYIYNVYLLQKFTFVYIYYNSAMM